MKPAGAKKTLLARAAATTAIVMAAGVGCASEHPRLVTPGEGLPFGLGIYDVKEGAPYAMVDEFRVCLDQPGSVTIVDVAVEYNIGGMRVDSFAVRPNRYDYPVVETDDAELWEYGFEPGAVEVDVVCEEAPEPNDHYQLGVQFSKPTDETARVANLLVSYESGGSIHTLKIPFQLVLCETSDGDGECASWEIEEYEELDRA